MMAISRTSFTVPPLKRLLQRLPRVRIELHPGGWVPISIGLATLLFWLPLVLWVTS